MGKPGHVKASTLSTFTSLHFTLHVLLPPNVALVVFCTNKLQNDTFIFIPTMHLSLSGVLIQTPFYREHLIVSVPVSQTQSRSVLQ